MEYKTLSNGVEIPQLGFGVFQIPPQETKDVVKKAIEVGYRHFDTAQAYFNEAEIGEAIKESGIAREELFITTKVWVSSYGYDETKKAFQESLDKLQTDYVDLYLLHQCMGDVYSTWRAVEDLYKEGKIKAIGVCNFTQGRFTDLSLHAEIPPMVNQIEVNPFYQQEGTVEFHNEFDAVVEAWGPLAEGKDDIFNNPILSEIGSKYEKSVAQVILRWLIQRDIVVFPKSTKESRMLENADVFDFELTDEDMEKIKELETGVPIVEVDNPEFIKFVVSSIA
ncbi:aldo/keto reductase [Methanobrevibacter sp.]|uniref:aldo/keto reductase n=1 Tax=Methanobrevibacter sp. TaxID=66852 RepID=UPI0025E73976|nr:aldo/keto reductase [Methanobrevibacter sp.]MBQ6511257.1 aldo/keto reductase [Methanobrevibacter sp.]